MDRDALRGARIIRAAEEFYGPPSLRGHIKVEVDEERCEGPVVLFTSGALVLHPEDYLNVRAAENEWYAGKDVFGLARREVGHDA